MPKLRRYARRSARVLLLDGAGRVLLLRFRHDPDDPTRGYGWVTPGGGVRFGETLRRAAARELHEEVGLAVKAADLGAPVAHTDGYAALGFARGRFRDDFFVHRVGRHEVDTGRMESRERGVHAGHRWWTADELASTTDTVYPFGLAALLADLLADRVPAVSVALPWHHEPTAD